MGLKLGQNFEKLESFCIKNYRKISLGFSMKKEIDQFIIFFVALVRKRASLKIHHHFEEHITVQIWYGENSSDITYAIITKGVSKSVQSKEVSSQFY